MSKFRIFFILGLVVLLGTYVRFVNISPYKFYPDSYQNLVVAKNITTYGSVAGALGERGASYPPYFMWSRPTYPLFINLTNYFAKDLTGSAQIVSFIFGVLTLPAIYFLAKEIFGNRIPGLIAVFLLAVSFNHTVWGGFIMSESTGIFFSTVYFALLFFVIKKKSEFTDVKELFTGAILSLAVYSRYEYLMYLVPTIYLLLTRKFWKVKLINILIGFTITSLIIFALIFPPLDTLRLFIDQTKTFMLLGFGALVLLMVFKYLYKILFSSFIKANFPKYFSVLFYLLSVVFILLTIFNFEIPYFTGLSNFIKTDFLISVLGMAGVGYLFYKKEKVSLGIFVVILLVTMGVVYYRVNPLQQRYNTHSIVFFIIPAVYFLTHFYEYLKRGNSRLLKVYSLFLAVAFATQMYQTYLGFRNWNDGDWTRESYEEASAKKLEIYLNPQEFLIASMPEPYFYFTSHPTRSLSSDYPFVYTKDLPPEQDLVIVNDMGMTDIFPGFAAFIADNLSDYKYQEYKVESNYRYRTYRVEDSKPVTIYRLKVKQLNQLVDSNK